MDQRRNICEMELAAAKKRLADAKRSRSPLRQHGIENAEIAVILWTARLAAS